MPHCVVASSPPLTSSDRQFGTLIKFFQIDVIDQFLSMIKVLFPFFAVSKGSCGGPNLIKLTPASDPVR